MLSDVHMNVAQKLLGEQFPQLQSLQSTLLSQTSCFVPVSECGGFYPEGVCWYNYMYYQTCMLDDFVFNANNQCFYLRILFVPERHHWVANVYCSGKVHSYL